MKFNAIDLFCGTGGLSEGLKQSGFSVVVGVEKDHNAARTYVMNHPTTALFEKDVRDVSVAEVLRLLGNRKIHLLAGCPPCQGFSMLRRLNRKKVTRDHRNMLLWEFFRFVKGLRPYTLFMENVPGLLHYSPFDDFIVQLEKMGYFIEFDVLDLSMYGVPQKRKRLVLLASMLGKLSLPVGEKKVVTVRDIIGKLGSPEKTLDSAHRQVANHTTRIREIISKIPKDGGSRKDLPKRLLLECHLKENIGFSDVYGRLKWDSLSSTITGGCLNPSKGRFLHPSEDRVITPREAALLQTFPKRYLFPPDVSKTALGTLIGDALPPKFSRKTGTHIIYHLKKNLGRHF